MLAREASPLEYAAIQVLGFDSQSLTADIQFSVTPKEISPNTVISLDFGDEVVEMERNGFGFSSSISRDIFSPATPLVLIHEGDSTRIATDRRISADHLMEQFLPRMMPMFFGMSSHRYGGWEVNGNLLIQLIHAAAITFEQMYLLVTVDGAEILRTDIPMEYLGGASPMWNFSQTFDLDESQVVHMYVIAADSIGLTYRHLIWAGGQTARGLMLDGARTIYASDGTALWVDELTWFE